MYSTADPGSFRDPLGSVRITRDESGEILYERVCGKNAAEMVRSPLWNDFAMQLVSEGKLVGFQLDGDTMRLETIPFISYPYEWCPEQLKAAALLTLEIQERALKCGLCLRDASAFNVQFIAERAIFIDHLSIGIAAEKPWEGYRQFCEHFFAPLVIASRLSPQAMRHLWQGINGIPLGIASEILDRRGRLDMGVQLHIHQHAKAVRSSTRSSLAPQSTPSGKSQKVRMSIHAQIATASELARSIEKLTFAAASTVWTDYYDSCNYTAKASAAKDSIVQKWLFEIQPKTVLDLGANDGHYSKLAVQNGAFVVAAESDIAVVSQLWSKGETNILPLCIDLCSPSPGVGFMGLERAGFVGRSRFDLVLGLALVHHLVFSGQLTLPMVAALFAACGDSIIVEWIESEDSYVQRLTANRTEGKQPYSRAEFDQAFAVHFDVVASEHIPDSMRTLVWLRKK